jgi:hypothetical protein
MAELSMELGINEQLAEYILVVSLPDTVWGDSQR